MWHWIYVNTDTRVIMCRTRRIALFFSFRTGTALDTRSSNMWWDIAMKAHSQHRHIWCISDGEGWRVRGGRGVGHTSWSRARAAPPGAGAGWRPRWWRAPPAWGATGPACRPWRASRGRSADPPRAAELCRTAATLGLTRPGGLSNNAGRPMARLQTDVSAAIDRSG